MYAFATSTLAVFVAAVLTAALPSSHLAERQTVATGTCDIATQTCNITQPADLAGIL